MIDTLLLQLSLIAKDLGNPPKTSDVSILSIRVIRNENPPSFDRKLYTETIQQNAVVGLVVTTVRASDPDPVVRIPLSTSICPHVESWYSMFSD